VPAEEVSQRVPMDVHKNKDSDKVSNEGSDEDWDGDEVFPENTAKGKNKKRERTEADKVSNEGSDEELEEATPVKKKAKKSPSKAPTKKTARRKLMPRKTGGKVGLNAEHTKYGKIKEKCIVCVEDKHTDIANAATVRENGHVWLSLCEEYFEILKDKEVMEEIKDVMVRAKTIKDNEKEKEKVVSEDRRNCGLCRGKFRDNYFCIQCV